MQFQVRTQIHRTPPGGVHAHGWRRAVSSSPDSLAHALQLFNKTELSVPACEYVLACGKVFVVNFSSFVKIRFLSTPPPPPPPHITAAYLKHSSSKTVLQRAHITHNDAPTTMTNSISLAIHTAAITFLCAAGNLLSVYSYHVEAQVNADESYEAMCDISDRISCTKVFASP